MSNRLYDVSQEQALNSRVNTKNERDANVVHSTRNYGLFRFSSANRPISQKHLERLYDAVSEKNLLDQYPITVTPNMLVIDGQHRLKVADALDVPIYYKIATNMSVDDIRMINDVNLKWSMADYLHYWCEMGNEEYKKIAAFLRKWEGVGISFAVQFLSNNTPSHRWTDVFRSGATTTRRLDELERMLKIAHDFKPYIKARWATRHFLYAAKTLHETPGYKHEIMMARMEYQSTRLVPCVNTEDYLTLLSEIYNYRTREENRLDFVAQRKNNVKRTNDTNLRRKNDG